MEQLVLLHLDCYVAARDKIHQYQSRKDKFVGHKQVQQVVELVSASYPYHENRS